MKPYRHASPSVPPSPSCSSSWSSFPWKVFSLFRARQNPPRERRPAPGTGGVKRPGGYRPFIAGPRDESHPRSRVEAGRAWRRERRERRGAVVRLPAPFEETRTDDKGRRCVLCCENVRSACLSDCGHVVACVSCVRALVPPRNGNNESSGHEDLSSSDGEPASSSCCSSAASASCAAPIRPSAPPQEQPDAACCPVCRVVIRKVCRVYL